MTKRKGTSRSRSRKIFKKSIRTRGKISLSRYFSEFKNGDQVVIKMEPAVQKGACHVRFHGKVGIVQEKRGKCYEIEIKDGSKRKSFCMHPVHLRKIVRQQEVKKNEAHSS